MRNLVQNSPQNNHNRKNRLCKKVQKPTVLTGVVGTRRL